MKLARAHGFEVREQAIPRELLYLADEIFLTGTAAEITPVRSVDHIKIGAGKRGPVTEALQSAFFGLFTGKTPDKWGWLEPCDDSARTSRSAPDRIASAHASRSMHLTGDGCTTFFNIRGADPVILQSSYRCTVRTERQSMNAKTLFEKVWEQHEVVPETADTPAVLYIDLHLVHEVTSPQAFSLLRSQGLKVRRTDRTLATMDHSTPTDPDEVFGRVPIKVESAARQVKELEKNCREFGVELLGLGSDQRGIVHVIGPELGATQPGKTIVCGDSHTATHGAFGALAFGIGTTEVGHVLATQCLLQRRPKTLAIEVKGRLAEGVTAKDLILAIIGKIGVSGGTGHVIEYRGTAIEALSMDERMTVCNMSIEAGARAGMIAPDETTFAYLKGRRFAPQGAAWDKAVAAMAQLKTDPGARFDRVVEHRCEHTRAHDYLRHAILAWSFRSLAQCRFAPTMQCTPSRLRTWD